MLVVSRRRISSASGRSVTWPIEQHGTVQKEAHALAGRLARSRYRLAIGVAWPTPSGARYGIATKTALERPSLVGHFKAPGIVARADRLRPFFLRQHDWRGESLGHAGRCRGGCLRLVRLRLSVLAIAAFLSLGHHRLRFHIVRSNNLARIEIARSRRSPFRSREGPLWFMASRNSARLLAASHQTSRMLLLAAIPTRRRTSRPISSWPAGWACERILWRIGYKSGTNARCQFPAAILSGRHPRFS